MTEFLFLIALIRKYSQFAEKARRFVFIFGKIPLGAFCAEGDTNTCHIVRNSIYPASQHQH